MALYGALSRHTNLVELTKNREFPSYQSAATRQAEARANLGMGTAGQGAITPGTAKPSQPMVTDANNGIAGFRDTRATAIYTQAAPAAKTTSATLTAAELMGQLITDQGAGAAVALTLPLATDLETALIAAYPNLQVNDSFDFSVINLSSTAADDITMTTNTGWTLVGNMVITEQAAASGANSVGMFRVRRTAANTYTLYRIG